MTKRFAINVAAWAEQKKADMRTVAIKSAIDLVSSIRLKTPVGNPDIWKDPGSAPPGYVGGTLRQNWILSLNVPSKEKRERANGVFPELRDDFADIAAFKPGDVIYIVNNQHYAARVEHGWSKQAPAGMLAVSIMEWPQIVRSTQREVFRK